MDPKVSSISSSSCNIRQDIFPLEQWTITTRKGIIMQSRCTCDQLKPPTSSDFHLAPSESQTNYVKTPLCAICDCYRILPQLASMPDMLFKDNLFRLEHYSGVGIEFNAIDALKEVEDVKDPLRVAVADGWQSARSDFPFAKSVVKPFDWTFTTSYRGTLLKAARKTGKKFADVKPTSSRAKDLNIEKELKSKNFHDTTSATPSNNPQHEILNMNEAKGEGTQQDEDDLVSLVVEETTERIDVNKLKVREEILFYDDVTLYEDELADHGIAQFGVKVRVMPRSLFILARFYLRIDGVLARINDTRVYHEFNKQYLVREYTNREAKLSSLNLPLSILVDPNELMQHLPIIQSRYERLSIAK